MDSYVNKEHPFARDHVIFEKEFVELAKKHGLTMTDMSYHHLYPDPIKAKLRNNTSPVSILVRTTPDFLCFDDGSYYELKTGTSLIHLNLEAYPFMANLIRCRELGIPCAYVYKGAITNNEIVMCDVDWIQPQTLVIPKDDKNNAIKDKLKEFFQCICVERERSKIFSNDAYIDIPAEQVQKWLTPDEYWKKA